MKTLRASPFQIIYFSSIWIVVLILHLIALSWESESCVDSMILFTNNSVCT